MAAKIEPPPNHVKDFDYKWKNWLNNLFLKIKEEGVFLEGGKFLTQSDTPYSMANDDEVIYAVPDNNDTIVCTLIPGERSRLVRLKNYNNTANGGTFRINPASGEEIQIDTTPTVDGNLDLSKGEAVTLVFTLQVGWLIL